MNPSTLEKYKALLREHDATIRKTGWDEKRPAMVAEADRLSPGINATGWQELNNLMWELYEKGIK